MFYLETCVWEITLACCFSCKYCGSKGGHARNDELSTAECLDVVVQLSDLGCRRVSLIGGEIFLRPDWFTIVKALTAHGIKTAIVTNGYLLTLPLLSKLKEAKVESIAVSIDGTEEIHDFIRQKGSFRRAIQAIDILLENQFVVSVISTIYSKNIVCMEALYQILLKRPIYAWQLQACSPMGYAAENGIDYAINYNDVIDFVKNHIHKAPFKLGIADNIGYFTEDEGYLRGNLSGFAFFSGCQAGLSSIGIDSIGNVRGCESMYDASFVEGNLREKCLREIWNDPDAFSYNRRFRAEQLTGKCHECRFGTLCAGGCRAYNYFTHGKLFEAKFCARKDN